MPSNTLQLCFDFWPASLAALLIFVCAFGFLSNELFTTLCRFITDMKWGRSGQDDLADFQRAAREWADATFPDSTARSRLIHLREEIDALIASPGSAEEMADVLLILSHHAEHYGVDLLEAAREKLEINRGVTHLKD